MNDPILHPASERLQAFVEGALESADRALVESHLPGCAQCRGEVEEWSSLFAVLSAMPRFEPKLNFADRVMAQVVLPDPWYVRSIAHVSNRIQVYAPKTTRGWAAAAAFVTLPLVVFSALVFWVFSQSYVTPQGVVAFAFDRVQNAADGLVSTVLSAAMHSNVTLFALRAFEAISNAGLGAAGALAAAISMATALSAWVLYQNLFRTTKRENRSYVSYSF